MESKKIFIIEDEEKIREELTKFLEKYGYVVESSDDFENIVDTSLRCNPNMILLDINLPYYDGYYICREIRKKSQVPIIVVTSRQSEMDELMSMNLGADDFVTKPYNTQILLARIASIMKRTYSGIEGETEIFNCRGLKYNMSTSEVSFNDEVEELTKNESKILNILSLEFLQGFPLVWKSLTWSFAKKVTGSTLVSQCISFTWIEILVLWIISLWVPTGKLSIENCPNTEWINEWINE